MSEFTIDYLLMDLKKHVRIHALPFKYTECSYAAADKISIVRHIPVDSLRDYEGL